LNNFWFIEAIFSFVLLKNDDNENIAETIPCWWWNCYSWGDFNGKVWTQILDDFPW